MNFDIFAKDLGERIVKKEVKTMVITMIEWLLRVCVSLLKRSTVDIKERNSVEVHIESDKL